MLKCLEHIPVAVSSVAIPLILNTKNKYRFSSLIYLYCLGNILAESFLSHVIFNLARWDYYHPYLISLWFCSFILHQSN